jgi:hypothetical protein
LTVTGIIYMIGIGDCPTFRSSLRGARRSGG